MSSAAVLAGAVLAFLGTVIVGMLTYTQSRKSARDAPYGDMVTELKDTRADLREARDRMDDMQRQIDDLRAVVREARDDAHESRNAAEQAVTENMAWEGHHLLIVRDHVGTLRKPWPPIPAALLHRITHADYPALPVIPDPDPGTPGTT